MAQNLFAFCIIWFFFLILFQPSVDELGILSCGGLVFLPGLMPKWSLKAMKRNVNQQSSFIQRLWWWIPWQMQVMCPLIPSSSGKIWFYGDAIYFAALLCDAEPESDEWMKPVHYGLRKCLEKGFVARWCSSGCQRKVNWAHCPGIRECTAHEQRSCLSQ